MKISERWLREWTDPGDDVEAIAETLTLGGLEVDAVNPAGPRLEGVVVGAIQAVTPHHDADHLRVCTVSDGSASYQVVCGAPNARVLLKTAFARPGAVLADGQVITHSRIRGVDSHGMLCSSAELGLSDDAAGIIELPASARVGLALTALLELDDTVLDVNLTPNRGDCFSVIGIARDLAALRGLAMKAPVFAAVPAQSDRRVQVEIADPSACPTYAGRVITGIDPAAITPLWMRERLRRAGVRSIHPVVDITHYVMLELGQPMHAFDLDKLSAPIVVRGAHADERIVLLDDRDLQLAAGSLVITDQSGPIALAGIMGGAATAVSSNTRNIFFESAFFEPIRLAGVARRCHLQTDASQRFERGVDPTQQSRAIERATRLLLDICGGVPGQCELTQTDAASVRNPICIALRPAAVGRLLGFEVEPLRMAEILRGLELAVDSTGPIWQVSVPAFRFDLTMEADLIEEVARVVGYAAIPLRLPLAASRPAATLPSPHIAGTVRSALSARGYFEAITYSFIDPALAQMFAPDQASVPLANPISQEMSVLRRSLWPGLVAVARHNLNRQTEGVRLFELGMVFQNDADGFVQFDRIAGLRCGTVAGQHWAEPARETDFYDIKQDVEALLRTLGKVDATLVPGRQEALHPGQCALITVDGVVIGSVGAVHPAVARAIGISKPLFLFEISSGDTDDHGAAQFQPISKFPAVRRDLAVVVADAVAAADCLAVARDAAGPLLRDLQLFDVYRGQGIDSGKKSLALGLIFQALSSTLTDDEVDQAVKRVTVLLRERVGGTLRE